MSRKKLHVSAVTPMRDLPNDPSYFHTSNAPNKEHKNHKNTSSSKKQEEGEAVTGRNTINEEVIKYDFGKYEHLVAYLISPHQVSFGVFLPLWIWDAFYSFPATSRRNHKLKVAAKEQK